MAPVVNLGFALHVHFLSQLLVKKSPFLSSLFAKPNPYKRVQAIMWNNGSLYPIQGKFVDDSVCTVVPKGSTWVRNTPPLRVFLNMNMKMRWLQHPFAREKRRCPGVCTSLDAFSLPAPIISALS